jgi:hypothetical protein
MYGGMETKLHALLISTLHYGKDPVFHPEALSQGK